MGIFSSIKSIFTQEPNEDEEIRSIYDRNQEIIQDFTLEIHDTCHQLVQISEPQYEQFNSLYEKLSNLNKSSLIKLPSEFIYSDTGNDFFTAIAYTKLYYWVRSNNDKKEHEIELILSEEIDKKKRLSPTLRSAIQKICFEENTDQNKYKSSLDYFRQMCIHEIKKLSEAET